MKPNARKGLLGVFTGLALGIGGVLFGNLFNHIEEARKLGQPPVLSAITGSMLIVGLLTLFVLVSVLIINRGTRRQAAVADKDNW